VLGYPLQKRESSGGIIERERADVFYDSMWKWSSTNQIILGDICSCISLTLETLNILKNPCQHNFDSSIPVYKYFYL